MKKRAHIISHTHWDREWYINSRYVNEWLPQFFAGLFAMMEKEPEYRFVLDGQTSILDDCYKELEKGGENVEAFRKKVSYYAKRGQLILGPYYLQPDWQLVSGESLIRNMMIGRKMSRELGGGTNTGWLLDNFGQIAQAPQLHQQFDMKGIVVWRGIEQDPFDLKSEFEWVGADGTAMVCSYLLSSYRNAMHLADYPAIIYDRIRNETEKIAPFSTTGNVLLMNGYDQEMQPDDILPHIRDGKADFGEFTVCQSSPDMFMDALLRDRKELPQFKGALYSGRYISVFPGILSSRMYLKQKNDSVQRELEKYAEPLNTMCAMLGKLYPHDAFETNWKLLLKNHPHDSICGVSVDDVHHDMEDRLEESMKQARNLTLEAVGFLNAYMDTSYFDQASMIFTVFNTLAFRRETSIFLPYKGGKHISVRTAGGQKCVVQPCQNGLIVKVVLGAFSAEALGIFEEDSTEAKEMSLQNFTAENEFLQIKCNLDGTFDVTDKRTQKTYTGVGALEDSADSGDEYNYSFLTGDKPITTRGLAAKISVVESGHVRTVFRVSRVWKLPEALNKDRSARSEISRDMPIETMVTLTQGDPVLRFHTEIRNTCRDHRIRVLFPTGMNTQYSYAQTQFDVTKHPITPKPFNNDNIPDDVKRIIIGARESLPITQFPQLDFCAVSDGETTAAVLNRGLPEYEVLPEQTTVALTLFRSIGWLTRFDLNTRIGDAGPEMLTPGAQCLRDMQFDYGFCTIPGQPDSKELDQISQSFSTPPLVAQTDAHSGKTLPKFLEIESNDAIHLTAVKCAEGGNDVIVRMYNASDCKANAEVTLPFCDRVGIAFAYEDWKDGEDTKGCRKKIVMNPRQILTIRGNYSVETAPKQAKQPDHLIRGERFHFDFSEWEIPPCVTEAEVYSETERADRVEQEYLKNCEIAEAKSWMLSSETTNAQERADAYVAVMRTHAAHRAALEARLSAVFAKEALARLNKGNDHPEFLAYQASLTKQLRELAYSLNLARIDKRVSEYIADYYTHQAKLQQESQT